jgi:serine protease Do
VKRLGTLVGRLPVALLGLTGVVSFLLGLVAAGTKPAGGHAPSAVFTQPVTSGTAPALSTAVTAPAAAPSDFAAVAARLRPSVVNVYATTRGSTEGSVPVWRYPREAAGEPASNAGGGFLIQPSGYILTNAHVIRNADRVMVTLSDNRVLRADIIGADPTIDVALLHVDAIDDLPSVTFGRSANLHVGEWVCAIGNPVGYTGSVTVGVVSSLEREIPLFESVSAVGLIQTDAAMSLGSSGGPLVNARGQVVGITTAISTQSANIGFAIPIDQITAVLTQLRERGRVPRGFLSMRVAAVTPELRRALQIAPDHGAVIEEVAPDRSADRAGLRTYDVIESIDDRAVQSESDFVHTIAAKAPGTMVRLGVWRDGSRLVIPAKLEELPSPVTPRPAAPVRPAANPSAGPLGLAVQDLTPAAAKKLPDAVTGVLLAEVDPAGPAQVAGLRQGFVILEVNRRRTATTAEFAAAQALLKPGDAAAVLFYDPALREYRLATVVLDAHP